MSNLNDFNREAKAALRVALQWLLLAVPRVWSAAQSAQRST